ncbi:CMGC/CDK/CRK7 protein kinase, variant [Phytophthora nicotianae P10297]|uniref:Cyclin-dependent kinase 2 homolog n=1 Tax=Phytophthora nicotianae P10297 TaxID=1317064 RepID=W2ZCJ3_PHYNI|nr:CMGC/CDK/CRK7 protein kinase, variant [Phytophthora nicotianae P10297]
MAPPPPSGPPAPSSPPPPPPSHSAASPASSASKRPSKSATKARRTARTPPGLPLPTPDKPKSSHSSSFSSPLPPCPEDPPAPPPPSCTPPKYRPLEENDDDTRSVESADEPAEPQSFPTPPPPPSPPVASPLGTPPPPPPPPFSPPNAKIAIDLSGALENAVQATEQTKMPPPPPKERQESEGEDGDDEQEKTGSSTDLTALADASSSSVIASMRSAVREREIMATETVREEPTKKPRFYIGDIDNYSIIDKVGSGTYGEVFKCQHKVTKDIVALKKLRPDVEKNGFPVTSIREMKILKYLKHPNILELKEIVSSSAPPKEGKRPPLYFAFEYMEHDLSGLLNHPRVKFTRTQIQCYMRQLLTGIAFMHRNKIIHRDIKASNLLLNNQGMLKVGDFGLSRFWNEVNAKAGRYTNKVVTLWYRPPELLMGSTSYDFSVDVWSIGCIFGELLLGKPILQGKTEIEQLQLIFGLCGMPTEETWPGFFKLPGAESFQMDDKFVCPLRERFKNFPPHAVDLLEKLLQLDPAKRITAAEAMDHDYFWRVQTCKPRDLPKFSVSSTHEYQSKKRHHEEMAAAAAANGGNAKNSDQHRYMRQRGERSGYRERNDHYRSGGHHSRSDRSRPYRSHRPNSDYYDRDRDRDRSRSRSRERHHDRDRRDRERER